MEDNKNKKGNRNEFLPYLNTIAILLMLIFLVAMVMGRTGEESITNNYYTPDSNDHTPGDNYYTTDNNHYTTNYNNCTITNNDNSTHYPPQRQQPDPVTHIMMFMDDFNITEGLPNITAQIYDAGELTIVYVFVNVTSVDEPINETEDNSTYMIRGKGTSTDGRYNLIIRELETEPEDDLYYCNQSTYNASYLGEILSQQEFDEIVEEHDRLVAEVMAERELYEG